MCQDFEDFLERRSVLAGACYTRSQQRSPLMSGCGTTKGRPLSIGGEVGNKWRKYKRTCVLMYFLACKHNNMLVSL